MNVFRATFTCGNCGNEWFADFERGDELDQQWNGPYLRSHACEGGLSCRACHRIECPNCGDTKKVKVFKREPLAEALR